MSIWSRLFGSPNEPLCQGVIKAIKEEGFALRSFLSAEPLNDDHGPLVNKVSRLVLCQLEFLYFYFSLIDDTASRFFDEDARLKLSEELRWTLAPRALDHIFSQLGMSQATKNKMIAEYIRNLEKDGRRYRESKIDLSCRSPSASDAILPVLAKQVAFFSGNVDDLDFHQSIINLAYYDVVNMNLEALVGRAAKAK